MSKECRNITKLCVKKSTTSLVVNGIATAELVGSASEGRALQVPLIIDGKVELSAIGIAGVTAARAHHQMAIKELPAAGFRLSSGEPAVPTTFV